MQKTFWRSAGLWLFMGLAFWFLYRTAWIASDACITLRSALNFTHGYGAVYNLGQRVQAYTHPLWFLLISALNFAGMNIFAAPLLLDALFSLATLWLIARSGKDIRLGLLLASVLILSKACLDFSSSGLENPLSNVLAVAGFLCGFKYLETGRMPMARWSCLLLGALYLAHPDLCLMALPFVLFIAFRSSPDDSPRGMKALNLLMIAVLPGLIWTLFSVVYYGFPFPNTAYAKLGGAIPLADRAFQGCLYLADSLRRDPLTLSVIAIGLGTGMVAGGGKRATALGMAAYLAWVVASGGDFMSGRLFTAPLATSLVLLSCSDLGLKAAMSLALLVLALSLVSIRSTILSGQDFDDPLITHGIADERGVHFQRTSVRRWGFRLMIKADWTVGKREVLHLHGVGIEGFYVGPGTTLVDTHALVDPLLARLPSIYRPDWRIGHLERHLPEGYLDSLRQGKNLIKDEKTRDLWEEIKRVTEGPLFTRERWASMVKLNLGLGPKPDPWQYRYGKLDELETKGSGLPK